MGNKKEFYKYENRKRRFKEHVGLLLTKGDNGRKSCSTPYHFCLLLFMQSVLPEFCMYSWGRRGISKSWEAIGWWTPEEAACIQIQGATWDTFRGAERADNVIATLPATIREKSLLLQDLLND